MWKDALKIIDANYENLEVQIKPLSFCNTEIVNCITNNEGQIILQIIQNTSEQEMIMMRNDGG